ncbi:acyl-CoA thioesterase [Actinomycetospora straminea]|uniref:Tol-pal system-associated acyl-CoA thioesterase n=1 Tax=Actinomycetospora straminea TaxID=663607 RepID=A0ABP9EHF6_9PSEU|nr:thioesterase family protein [Actinomycetospora straminea]MDD7933769.1 thioesterase family protein [Actinomycetospora straminea]
MTGVDETVDPTVLHTERLRVAWADTDAGGRIHWTAVFRWAELAEHALLRRLGRDRDEAGPYPRRSTDAVYHRALEFDDEIEVRLGVAASGRTSVTFRWHITRDDELCVEGHHTVVHVGADGRAAPWPEHLRAGLSSDGLRDTGTPGSSAPASHAAPSL